MGVVYNYFTFDGVSSRKFNVWISGGGTFDAPERDTDEVEIPGRSGNLIIDNKRFKNMNHPYDAFISRDFAEKFNDFRAFLMSRSGYCRLEDTYHPDEFYLAQYKGPITPDVGTICRSGQFTVTFNRKPQRFLKLGEQEKEYTASGTINNPTFYESKPLVRVYGTGQLGVGGETITINSTDGYTDIDCEQQNAFYGAVNCNGRITLSSRDFPVLPAGKSSINLGSGITKVIVKPRWYTI